LSRYLNEYPWAFIKRKDLVGLTIIWLRDNAFVCDIGWIIKKKTRSAASQSISSYLQKSSHKEENWYSEFWIRAELEVGQFHGFPGVRVNGVSQQNLITSLLSRQNLINLCGSRKFTARLNRLGRFPWKTFILNPTWKIENIFFYLGFFQCPRFMWLIYFFSFDYRKRTLPTNRFFSSQVISNPIILSHTFRSDISSLSYSVSLICKTFSRLIAAKVSLGVLLRTYVKLKE